MPEQQKPAAKKQAGVAEQDQQAAAAQSAGKAGESSDPVVQDLLARREIALRNEDTDEADAVVKELKEEHGLTVD